MGSELEQITNSLSPVPALPRNRGGLSKVTGGCRAPEDPKYLPTLLHFNRARRELELATTIDEVKQIRDKAEAMRAYARQAQYSLEMQNKCAEIKLRAERRLGEMLQDAGIAERRGNNLLRGRTMQPRDEAPSLEELGVSKSQSSRCQFIARLSNEQFEEKIQEIKESGKELTSKGMVDFARYLEREQTRASERDTAIREGTTAQPEERYQIVLGDFRETLTEPLVESSSVDLILTDPPYGKDYLPLWSDLAMVAARLLKPGKLLVSYSGTYHLEEVIARLSEHLQYVWTATVMNGTPPDTVFALRIMTYWKPVLLFSRGDYRPVEKRGWFKDRIDGDGRNKSHHDWEQGVGEANQLIEALTHEGNLVVDPFAGSGTTGVACKQLQRRFLGCDVDENTVKIASCRLKESH